MVGTMYDWTGLDCTRILDPFQLKRFGLGWWDPWGLDLALRHCDRGWDRDGNGMIETEYQRVS